MNRFPYTARSPYQVFLRLLEPEIVFSTLTRSLDPVGKAIQQSRGFIDCAANSGNEDNSEAVADDEFEIIESLLGTAFVICQTYVTCVVSRIKKLHSLFEEREKRALGGLDSSKGGILKQGASVIAGTTYSDVQVIDAFANYFKHREEWSTDWTQLYRPQADTRDIISAFGAASGSNSNLRIGAEALGNTEYHSVSLFADKLDVWRTNLKEAYEKQLKIEGVI